MNLYYFIAWTLLLGLLLLGPYYFTTWTKSMPKKTKANHLFSFHFPLRQQEHYSSKYDKDRFFTKLFVLMQLPLYPNSDCWSEVPC